MNGTVISFSTAYTATGSATCSYDLDTVRKADIAAVHTRSKNSLYVNGELVAEVDISEAQQADTYAHAGTTLSTGLTTSTWTMNINYIGLFPRALRTEEIQDIYRNNNRRPIAEVPKIYGGEVLHLGTSTRSPYIDTGWFTEGDWREGQSYQVEPEGETLYASQIDDLTLGGNWIGSVNLSDGDVNVPINSVNLWWDGLNETVEVSTNSTTWNTVTRATNLSIFTNNVTPTDATLYVRVTFPAGVDEAWIKNLRVHAYTGSTAVEQGRTITYPTSSTPLRDEAHPLELSENWGVKLNSGVLTISNTDATDYPYTVEIWYKRNTTITFSSNLTSQTSYINGVALSTERLGEWNIRHFVHTGGTGIQGDITITGGTIGQIAFYPTGLTTTEISNIISTYTGIKKLSSGSAGSIAFVEPANSMLGYSHDWEIQSS